MRKISKALSVTGGAALLLSLLSAEGSAQNRHWFYGNYGHYDGMTWGFFPPPPPPPAYPPATGQPATGQYDDPYAEPPPNDQPHRQRPRYAYQPPAYQPPPIPGEEFDPAIDDEPGFESKAVPPMTPRKPKSATAGLGADGEETASTRPAGEPGQGAVSCDKARGIVADFGFKDIKADSCSGKTYGFSATRDGKAFSIKVVAANGELAEVKRQ
jgi:hypothetical protein